MFVKYPDHKPSLSGYYYTLHIYEDKLYYKAHWWNNEKQEWIWRVHPTVISFVPESRSDYYTECLQKSKVLLEKK